MSRTPPGSWRRNFAAMLFIGCGSDAIQKTDGTGTSMSEVGSTNNSTEGSTTSTSNSPESPTTSTGSSTESSNSSTANTTGNPEPCNQVHEGMLYVSGNTDLASLANIERVTGLLVVSMGERIQPDLSFLSCLHTVDSALFINENNHLMTTEGLINLQTLGGLSIIENPNLRTVTGFDQIHELSLIEISENPMLEEIRLDSIETVKTIAIGTCVGMMSNANNLALTNLTGFSGLTNVEAILIDGNEALMSADLLDALAANGPAAPPVFARFRYNPLISEADIFSKLNALNVQDREICGNAGGMPECVCLVD